MKEIYLRKEAEKTKIILERTVIDRVPEKSGYYDSNRAGVIGSKTFKLPDDREKLKKLIRQSVQSTSEVKTEETTQKTN